MGAREKRSHAPSQYQPAGTVSSKSSITHGVAGGLVGGVGVVGSAGVGLGVSGAGVAGASVGAVVGSVVGRAVVSAWGVTVGWLVARS